jgi:hypothetical protein
MYPTDFGFKACFFPLVFLILVVGCSETKKPVPSQIKIAACIDRQTIERSVYDGVMETFKSRRAVQNFETLSNEHLIKYWEKSLILVGLFSYDLRACVIEKDGSTSVKVWTQESFNSEKEMLVYLSGMISKDGTQSRVQPPSSNVAGAALRPQPPADQHTGVRSSSELERFVLSGLNTSLSAKRVNLELQQARIFGSMGTYSQDDLSKKAVAYYTSNFAEIRPHVIDFMVKITTFYSTPTAIVKYAAEDSRFAPVIEYYKEKYQVDLSKVVVIDAPISTIPHAAGTFAQNSLGLFVSPVAVPIAIQIRLPLHQLDTALDRQSYLSGTLVVKVDDQLAMLIESLKFYFGSEMIFHVDSAKVASQGVGKLGLEGVLAHEVRHLLDFFSCQSNPTKECSEEYLNKDLERVREVGQTKQTENYQAFVSDRATAQSKHEIMQLYGKYYPSKTNSERQVWAENILQRAFHRAYMGSYQNYFSLKERSAYREHLKYLLNGGLSQEAAIEMVLKTGTGEKLPLSMDGNIEYVSWPGFPWLQEHLESLTQ